MSMTNTDLIDGYPLEPFEGRLGEMSAEVRLLNLLDRVPIDPQMASYICHGHVPRQFQYVPLKALGVSPVRVGKSDLYLSNHPTSQAKNPLNGKLDNRLSQTNRKRHEPPKHCSLLPDLSTPARGTFKSCWILTNPKDRPSLFKTSMNIMDSTPRHPKTVIEYPRGHAFLAFADSFKKPRRQNACPFSLFNKVRTYAKSQKIFD